jgi:hypothetical protein
MGLHPGPYDGMDDDELMAYAKRALVAAAEEAPGTVERAMKFAAHESIMNELRRRLANRLGAALGLPEIDF